MRTAFGERISRKTVNFEAKINPGLGPILEHVFASNGGYCDDYPSNILAKRGRNVFEKLSFTA